MGTGIDMAREIAPEHAQAMENMKDQLIIALMKRLADDNGVVRIPVVEIDDTAQDLLLMRADSAERIFHFELRKKP